MSENGDIKSKKRKRESVAKHGSNKKLHKSKENQASLSFSVAEGDNEWPPVVVSAPGLKFRPEEPLNIYKREKELLLTSSSHPKLDFLAQEERSGASESLMKHYLGIYDPDTGEVQVIPAKQLIMRTRLHDALTLEDDVEAIMHQSAYKARELLGQAFGTKKSKKALAALAENSVRSSKNAVTADGKVVLDQAASAVLETMKSVTGSMPSKELLLQASDDQKPRPKMNLEATAPSEVFSLDDLIGEENIKLLDTRSWRDDVKSGTEIQVRSAYVARRVEKVMNEGKDLKRSKKDRILRFYLTLHEWHSCMFKQSREGWKLPNRTQTQEKLGHVNEIVLEHIRHKFAPEGIMNRWRQGYLFTHLCALALLIDDFAVDMTDLQLDFGLERPQVQKYFEEIGCRTKAMTDAQLKAAGLTKSAASDRRLMVMKIPLQFPKVRSGRASARR